MKNTLNYNLKLPEYADIADIADLNYNAETIDAELINLKDEINTNKMDILLKLDKSGGDVTGIVNFKSNPKILNEFPVMDYIHTNGTTNSLGNFDGDGILKILSGNQRGEILTTGNCPISKYFNGWAKFANGLIVQWGSACGTVDVAFPISFSYPPRVITSGVVNDANPIYHTLSGCEIVSTNNFKLVSYGYMVLGAMGSGINNSSYKDILSVANFGGATMWLAIGY